MIYYIPSYSRAGSVRTIDTLKRYGLDNFVLCVRAEEAKAYHGAYPDADIMSIKKHITNIAETRAWMCRAIHDDVWAMVDDDIAGLCWKEDVRKFGGLTVANRSQVHYALYSLTPPIALPDRVTLARPHRIQHMLGPLRQFVFLNRDTARRLNYAQLPILEDIAVSLQMKTLGIDPLLHAQLGQVSPPTSRKKEKGGCGEYRERHPGYYAKAYRWLSETYPDYVTAKFDSAGRLLRKRIVWSKV